LFNFLHSFLSPPLFLNTFSLRFSLNVSDQVLHPYKQETKLLFCSS
jgi:hypothetical protein